MRGAVDFRKRFDGLLGESYLRRFDPYAGDCVVFIKRDRTQIRALVGDIRGLYLICRRFEGGSLRWLISEDTQSISVAELAMMFEGIDFEVRKKAKPWR